MRPPLLLLLSLLLSLSSALKILVYNPKHAYSHVNYIGRVADMLVEEGHSVTSLMPDIVPHMKNGTAKSEIVIVPPPKSVLEDYKFITDGKFDFFTTNLDNPLLVIYAGAVFARVFRAQCAATLDSGVVERLRKERFDVYLVETDDPCGMMLAHLLHPRSVILIGTTFLWQQQLDEVGIPRELSYNPSVNTEYLDVHSFWSRLSNVVRDTITQEFNAAARRSVDALFRERYGPDYPSISEQTSRVTFVFTNAEPLYDFAVPTLAKVVPVPGLGAREPQPLDEYWNKVLNERPKTVIIAFGTIANLGSMNEEYRQSFVKMFTAFPNVTFIMKYDELEDDYATNKLSKLDNVVLTAWMPQNDLLGVFIPLFFDQRRLGMMLEEAGNGVHLTKADVGVPEKFIAAVKEALEGENYTRRAVAIQKMLAGKPYSSKELLLKHVQFAGTYGATAVSRPRSHDMNWVEYQNADVWLFLVSSLFLTALLTVYVLIRIIRCSYRRCCRCCTDSSYSLPHYSARTSSTY